MFGKLFNCNACEKLEKRITDLSRQNISSQLNHDTVIKEIHNSLKNDLNKLAIIDVFEERLHTLEAKFEALKPKKEKKKDDGA